MVLKLDDIFLGSLGDLTPTHRKVLDYLLKNPEEAGYQTASKLAELLEVSDASVIRLAQALGYDGYPALRKRIRDLVLQKTSTVDRIDRSGEGGGDLGDVLGNVLALDIDNLRAAHEDLDRGVFDEVVEALRKARKTYVVAMRSAHCLAVSLTSALRFLGRDVVNVKPESGEMWEQLRDLGSEDVMVGFSFPRYTRATVEVMRHAADRGALVVAVTDSELSPLSATARWTLAVPYRMESFVESFTAALSLVNGMVTALALRDREGTIKALGEMEKTWAERGIYWT